MAHVIHAACAGTLKCDVYLELGTIFRGDVLPPALLELHTTGCDTMEPVSKLQFLRKFVTTEIPTTDQCVHLQAVSSLCEVSIGANLFSSSGHVGVGPELAKLPLICALVRAGGRMHPVPSDVVNNMHLWIKLRDLELCDTHIDATYKQLAGELVHISDLRHFVMVMVTA